VRVQHKPESSGLVTAGMIRAHYAADQDDVLVTAVHFDKRRNVLGGDEVLVDVRGGGVAYFEVVSLSLPKAYQSTFVFTTATQ